jgi:lysophospholipase L1-like esterase
MIQPRPIWIIALGICLVYVASSENAYPDDKPNTATMPVPRTDSGWQKRFQLLNERAKQGNVDLVFIGASTIQFWEDSGKEIWKKHYAPRKSLNLGISGDRTEHVLWRLQNGNLEGIRPKLAVLLVGSNNTNGDDNTAEEIAAGIEANVKLLRQKLPNTKILVLGIFPRGEKASPQREKIAEANKLVSKLADKKMIFYQDLGQLFLEPDGTLKRDLMPDLLHPNERGYEAWANEMEPSIFALMGENVRNGTILDTY